MKFKYGNKIYIPLLCFGEIQIGLKSRKIVVWWRGKCHVIKKGLPAWVWTDPRWHR